MFSRVFTIFPELCSMQPLQQPRNLSHLETAIERFKFLVFNSIDILGDKLTFFITKISVKGLFKKLVIMRKNSLLIMIVLSSISKLIAEVTISTMTWTPITVSKQHENISLVPVEQETLPKAAAYCQNSLDCKLICLSSGIYQRSSLSISVPTCLTPSQNTMPCWTHNGKHTLCNI